MVVERRMRLDGGWLELGDDSGQSLVEFVLLFPLLAAMAVILIRINTAIQVSIVNQQYARAQALYLTFNSPTYPQIRHLRKDLVQKQSNRMVLGVADNRIDSDEEGAQFSPEASVQMIARTAKKAGPKGPEGQEARDNRLGWVRVRNTVSLCTQLNVFNDKGTYKSIELREGVSPSAFAYCRSALDE